MAYRALYRTYRPKTFEQVIGQSHITTVLKNQIATGHVAHAYLFCGSRGTGKTSTAKIFARAVNCLSPVNGEPCGTCEACQRSIKDACPDIMEMDAASNRGIDNIRELIESAQYMPLELSKRVFILDEAHMITSAAFNALLKTLEEPPAHVMFILATTEPQKLPATIISRCQRFDFHRLTIEDIRTNLQSVLTQANAHIDEDGLNVIARSANGGMRDALSLADQCLSFCGDNVSKQDVYNILGAMDQEFLFHISDALLKSDSKQALSLLDEMIRNGRDMTVFCSDLAAHFRSLLLAKTCGACADLLDCTDDAMNLYLEQSKNVSETRLLISTELILKTQSEMAYITTPRALLESMLIRIYHPEHKLSLDNLEARIDRLENGSFTPSPVVTANPVTEIKASTNEIVPPAIPEKKTADVPKEEAAVKESKPIKQPTSPTISGTKDADVLWNAVKDRFTRLNPLMGIMASKGFAQTLTDSALVVGFPKDAKAQLSTLSTPAQMKLLNSIINEMRPGIEISLVSANPVPVSDDTENKLKEMLGDKLTIQD